MFEAALTSFSLYGLSLTGKYLHQSAWVEIQEVSKYYLMNVHVTLISLPLCGEVLEFLPSTNPAELSWVL